MNDDFALPIEFFDECSNHIPRSKRYFTTTMTNLVFNKTWNLYVPVSLLQVIAKGMLCLYVKGDLTDE